MKRAQSADDTPTSPLKRVKGESQACSNILTPKWQNDSPDNSPSHRRKNDHCLNFIPALGDSSNPKIPQPDQNLRIYPSQEHFGSLGFPDAPPIKNVRTVLQNGCVLTGSVPIQTPPNAQDFSKKHQKPDLLTDLPKLNNALGFPFEDLRVNSLSSVISSLTRKLNNDLATPHDCFNRFIFPNRFRNDAAFGINFGAMEQDDQESEDMNAYSTEVSMSEESCFEEPEAIIQDQSFGMMLMPIDQWKLLQQYSCCSQMKIMQAASRNLHHFIWTHIIDQIIIPPTFSTSRFFDICFKAPKLKCITLTCWISCPRPISLEPLKTLSMLQTLNIAAGVKIPDFFVLPQIRNLVSLQVCNAHSFYFPVIGRCSSLTKLNLCSVPSDVQLSCLESLSRLRSLDIYIPQTTNYEWSHDFSFRNLTQLTELAIRRGGRFNSDSFSILTNLSNLVLERFTPNPDLIEEVATLTKLRHLRIANLGNVNNLNWISQLTNLVSLHIANNSFISDHQIRCFSNLTSLTVDDCPSILFKNLESLGELLELDILFNELHVEAFNTIGTFTKLKKLSYDGIIEENQFYPIGNLKNLEELRLGLVFDTCGLFELTSLNYLEVEGLTNDEIHGVSRHLKHLTHFRLLQTEIDPPSTPQAIPWLSSLQSLQEFEFPDYYSLSKEYVNMLEKFKTFESLTVLHFGGKMELKHLQVLKSNLPPKLIEIVTEYIEIEDKDVADFITTTGVKLS